MAYAQKLNKEDWIAIDTATLSAELQVSYAELREARRVAAAKRKAFEDMMQEASPEGQRMVFGYNFGKLSIALVEGEAKPVAKAQKGAVSLSDFLKAKAALGDNA